ncbi:MAG: replication protein [Blastocatellia bacterium]
MVKPKDKPESEIRTPGPKRKPIIPVSFQIRRADNPMRVILDESEGNRPASQSRLDNKTSQVLETSLPIQTSQVSETSEVLPSSLALETSLDSITSPDRSETSLVTKSRLDTKAKQSKSRLDLMASLPDTKGFLKLYFQIIDDLYPQLDPFERAVHETLYRLSWGFGKPSCSISYQRIAERTGMSPKSAQRATARLEAKGLINKSGRVIGYLKEQGIEFSVVPPPRLVSESRLPRQSRQDSETNIIDTTTIDNTQTQVGVGVNSRFSLEECRRYADHLKTTGQGITNPGGYATKIFRSGEADTFIETFLSPPAQIDTTQCPDCKGRGFIYMDPTNADLGVKPCKHEALRN